MSLLRPARRTVSVCRQAMWSRSQTTGQIVEADSLRTESEAPQKFGTEYQTDEAVAADAQVSSKTTSDEVSGEIPKKSRLGFRKWRDERPSRDRLSHENLEAVTAAAQKWSLNSTRTYQKGRYVWLPLGEKQVMFHRIFLRDACKSWPFISPHSSVSDLYIP